MKKLLFFTFIVLIWLYVGKAQNSLTELSKKEERKTEFLIDDYIKMAQFHSNMCDYKNAYKFLIDALLLSEESHDKSKIPLIYNNLGNIYSRFKKYDIAKTYYKKSLSLCSDTISHDLIYNNLGYVEFLNGNTDSAFYFINKSLQICKQYHSSNLTIALDSKGSLFQNAKQYDSAFYYHRLALEIAKNDTVTDSGLSEAYCYSNFGNLFFEVGKPDSAYFYLTLSNKIAKKNNNLQILADNALLISKIEESKKNIPVAFEQFKCYTFLKDSLSSAEIFGDINELQRYYEVSKTNKQIAQLVFEQKVKERTIRLQRIVWITTSAILLLVSVGLLVFYLQKRNLSKAYKVLFEKNIEIIELQNETIEKRAQKQKHFILNDEKQNELAENILRIMEDSSVICDSEFTLAKLAVLLQSNHVYVSQVINCAFKKNFRLLLNSYRIKEAQRLFTEPDAGRYTIEFVANTVGFKSTNAFRNAFNDITGVSPSYYLQEMIKKTAY